MEAATKRKILTWIAIGVGCCILTAGFWYLSFIGQFYPYRDDMYKFRIKFPRKWQYVVHPMPGGAFAVYKPFVAGQEGFRDTVNVSVQDLPANIATIKDLTNTVLNQMKAVFNNLKVEISQPAMLGERKAWMVVFSADKPDPMKILTVWTIRDAEKAYIVTYIARAGTYQESLPLVEYMMKTFKTFNSVEGKK